MSRSITTTISEKEAICSGSTAGRASEKTLPPSPKNVLPITRHTQRIVFVLRQNVTRMQAARKNVTKRNTTKKRYTPLWHDHQDGPISGAWLTTETENFVRHATYAANKSIILCRRVQRQIHTSLIIFSRYTCVRIWSLT